MCPFRRPESCVPPDEAYGVPVTESRGRGRAGRERHGPSCLTNRTRIEPSLDGPVLAWTSHGNGSFGGPALTLQLDASGIWGAAASRSMMRVTPISCTKRASWLTTTSAPR